MSAPARRAGRPAGPASPRAPRAAASAAAACPAARASVSEQRQRPPHMRPARASCASRVRACSAARAWNSAALAVVAGLLEVLGRDAQEVAGAQAALLGQPPASAPPWRAPRAVALEHGVVGHLVQDLVPEGVLAQAVAASSAGARAAPARAAPAPAGLSRACASRAASAWSQNTGPMTLACCRRASPAAGRPSSRACSTPVSVGGTLVSEQPFGVHRPGLAGRRWRPGRSAS